MSLKRKLLLYSVNIIGWNMLDCHRQVKAIQYFVLRFRRGEIKYVSIWYLAGIGIQREFLRPVLNSRSERRSFWLWYRIPQFGSRVKRTSDQMAQFVSWALKRYIFQMISVGTCAFLTLAFKVDIYAGVKLFSALYVKIALLHNNRLGIDSHPNSSMESYSSHYKNTPIKIYWKFYYQKKKKIFRWKILIFFIFLLKT